MDIFGSLNSFMTSNPALAQLATSAVSNLTSSPKSAPKVIQVAPAVQTISAPSASGMSTGMMVGIGAAILAGLVVVVMIFKRK